MFHLVVIGFLVLWVAPAWAVEDAAPEPTTGEGSLHATWSATVTGQYKQIPPPENDDDVGGYFDQYEFTPNKSSSFPFELGLRDGALDVSRGQGTPLFQVRLESPTSNLGVSGSDVDQPFFNQRLEALMRLEGFDLDLEYRRLRTEQLRIFPNTEGPGLVFDDLSSSTDRFFRDRTGFQGEARLRPYEVFAMDDIPGGWLAPEVSLRGGYEWRDGNYQLRIHRGPSNDWIGLAQERDRSVSDVGGGLLVAPHGLLTLALDFDHERLRFGSPILTEGELGYPPPESSRTIGFVPNTNRSTGTLRFNSRLSDRAVIEGGFQIGQLEQVAEFTPDQNAAGLDDNRVRYYAANAALDVRLLGELSFNGFFKYDRRDNDIDRDTVLFNPANGTQIDPFVDHWQRFFVGGELALRWRRADPVAIGVRYEDIGRDLDFAQPGGRRILPANTVMDYDTRIVTLYGRSSARLWKRLRVNGELGYRWAPETGYATELDDHLYGSIRASYVFQLSRPVVVSAYVRGGKGKNEDFSMVSGVGAEPGGPSLPRSYERSNLVSGITASLSPVERLSLYGSFFYGQNGQDSSLDLSNLQRYWQDSVPIGFTNDGLDEFESQQWSLVLGAHLELGERTDGGLSYAFTSASALYSGSGDSNALDLVADSHNVDSDIHVVDFELGYWVLEGLRVLGGYRYQHYDEDAPIVQSVASAVAPYDRSTHQHTVTLGVTLTSDLFARAE